VKNKLQSILKGARVESLWVAYGGVLYLDMNTVKNGVVSVMVKKNWHALCPPKLDICSDVFITENHSYESANEDLNLFADQSICAVEVNTHEKSATLFFENTARLSFGRSNLLSVVKIDGEWWSLSELEE
jgi:hypothetical protein